jgi:SAM-dependent methyltransferase
MSSYDAIPDFGLLYDSVPAYNERPDVAFYVEEAGRAQGRVLELGCGTGRILLPMARAGVDVEGIDASRTMLARCREKLAGERPEVQARVRLQEGDVRDFDLGAQFALIIAPFRVLQHQTTVDDQIRCLQCVARHLRPGGRFLFDVFNPLFSRMVAADGAEWPDTSELTLRDGRKMRRAFRIRRVRWLDQVNEVELVYYVTAGDQEERYIHGFDMRWYLRSELSHLLARTGFREVANYGDFARGPLTETSGDHVVCAERVGAS